MLRPELEEIWKILTEALELLGKAEEKLLADNETRTLADNIKASAWLVTKTQERLEDLLATKIAKGG